jgi:hypothetical protein
MGSQHHPPPCTCASLYDNQIAQSVYTHLVGELFYLGADQVSDLGFRARRPVGIGQSLNKCFHVYPFRWME